MAFRSLMSAWAALLLVCGSAFAEAPQAAATGQSRLDDIAVVALAPADRAAVLRLPTGELRVVAVGEEVAGTSARVRAVAKDRITLDVPPREGESLPRRAWLSLSIDGKPSRVTWLARESPQERASQPIFIPGTAGASAKTGAALSGGQSSSLLLQPVAPPPQP